jgi:hypothetical protein
MDSDKASQGEISQIKATYVDARRCLLSALHEEFKEACAVLEASSAGKPDSHALKRIKRVEAFLETESMQFRMQVPWWKCTSIAGLAEGYDEVWEEIRRTTPEAIWDLPVNHPEILPPLDQRACEVVDKYIAWWMAGNHFQVADRKGALREPLRRFVRQTIAKHSEPAT